MIRPIFVSIVFFAIACSPIPVSARALGEMYCEVEGEEAVVYVYGSGEFEGSLTGTAQYIYGERDGTWSSSEMEGVVYEPDRLDGAYIYFWK